MAALVRQDSAHIGFLAPMPKEQYMCQLCANHGIFNQPKKGHKQRCPHKHCSCNLCALNTKRRALDQIERHLKSSNSGEKHSTTEVEVERPLSVLPGSNSNNNTNHNVLTSPSLLPSQQPIQAFSISETRNVNLTPFYSTTQFPLIEGSHGKVFDVALSNFSDAFNQIPQSRRSIFHSAEDLAR